jgi:hypothetical protein
VVDEWAWDSSPLQLYQIDSVSPVTIHNSVEGTGGLCSAIFIDKAYEEMFEYRLGDACSLSEKSNNQMMKDWEREIKSDYGRGRSNERCLPGLHSRTYQEILHGDDTNEEPYII